MLGISRALDLSEIIKRKTVFLFGPRQTGKTTYLKQKFPNAKYYSLLQNDIFLNFNRDPSRLRREITSNDSLIILDEIQKIPELLDEVHEIIETQKIRFILTGSSARKLKNSGTNLLGGRAAYYSFHPLVSVEMGKFELSKVLQFGFLPSIYLSPEPKNDLIDYTAIYLREEIAAEGLARNLPAFSRFLDVAALSHGQILNFTSLSNDAQVSKTTCYEYFQVLKDTLIAHEVPCFQKTKKRKALSTSKFYFFDIGVVRSLQGLDFLNENSADFGLAFESFLFQELKAYCDYYRVGEISYWRSQSGFEVDFVVGGKIAIEVKSSKRISQKDLKGLKALKEEGIINRAFLVCREERPQVWDEIEIMPWQMFLTQLWSREIA